MSLKDIEYVAFMDMMLKHTCPRSSAMTPSEVASLSARDYRDPGQRTVVNIEQERAVAVKENYSHLSRSSYASFLLPLLGETLGYLQSK